jgi:hypothetical protein
MIVTSSLFQKLTPLSILSFICIGLLTIFFIILTQELFLYFFPRKDAIPQRYPFDCAFQMWSNLHCQLDLIKGFIDTSYETRKKKTVILSCSVLPNLLMTTDVNNVQYILKDNFSNYGKNGNSLKPRLQGLLGDGIFNADGKQWFAHRKTSAHLFKMNKFKGNILDVFNDDLNQLIQVIRAKVCIFFFSFFFLSLFLLHSCFVSSWFLVHSLSSFRNKISWIFMIYYIVLL